MKLEMGQLRTSGAHLGSEASSEGIVTGSEKTRDICQSKAVGRHLELIPRAMYQLLKVHSMIFSPLPISLLIKFCCAKQRLRTAKTRLVLALILVKTFILDTDASAVDIGLCRNKNEHGEIVIVYGSRTLTKEETA